MKKSSKILALLLAMNMAIAGTGAAYAAESEVAQEHEQVQIEQSAEESSVVDETEAVETAVHKAAADAVQDVKAGSEAAIVIENDYLLYKTTGSDTVELMGYGDEWYDEYDGILNIPSSFTFAGKKYRVTSIGAGACNKYGLESLTIPSSVTSIGDYAFAGRLYDVNITIPDSVKSIGKYAFCAEDAEDVENSDDLAHDPYEYGGARKRLTLGAGVERIGEGAFAGQRLGGTLVIPASVKNVGEFAFYDCNGFTAVDNRSSAVIPATATDFGVNTKTEIAKKATWKEDGQINTVCDICGSRYRDGIWLIYEDGILKNNNLTYNGKVRKPVADDSIYAMLGYEDSHALTSKEINITSPASKNVGTYTAKVTLSSKYATGTKSVTYKIVPKGTTQKTPAPGKKSFTAKWAKQSTKMSTSRINGYQIRYSTSSTMSKAVTKKVKGYTKTSLKIGNLKANKKYYVQVRTYMVKNGKTYYSPWSAKKSVTTK